MTHLLLPSFIGNLFLSLFWGSRGPKKCRRDYPQYSHSFALVTCAPPSGADFFFKLRAVESIGSRSLPEARLDEGAGAGRVSR